MAAPEYDAWLDDVLIDHGIDLAISVNDFELSHWASRSPSESTELISLAPLLQRDVEDKLAMAGLLTESGIRVPHTQTVLHAMSSGAYQPEDDVVTKGRFGSGSRGLRRGSGRLLEEAALRALAEVTDAQGVPVDLRDTSSLDLLVVQPFVAGQEYGLDVVSDFDHRHAAVLARRKIAMRSGETDRAVSVDSGPFADLGTALAAAIPHRGVMDVDVIVDSEGAAWVIDVNPRFGGGYPFSHIAGADVPSAYVAWALGEVPDPSWSTSTAGVVGSKYVGVLKLP